MSKKICDIRGRPLSKNDLAEFEIAFKQFDGDNSGSIDRDEIKQAMAKLNWVPTEEELSSIIAEVDVDGNGTLDFNEFCLLMSKNSSGLTDEELKAAFTVLDQSGAGFLSGPDIRKLDPSLTDQQIGEMIQQADFDGDGQIRFGDFKRLMLGR